RRTRRDGLRDTVAGLRVQPILAVVAVGKAKGASELLSDALDVLDGYGVPTVIAPRSEVVRFATGSSRQGVMSLLAPLVHCWPDQHPWPPGEVGHGGPVAPIAACLGVAALGGTQPIPSSPGRDRALASVTWPTPLPLIDHR
ncbi:MAG: hypothetical protein KC933_32865, partial [Myxococcales bacterium]|nr:hypothetical protein [Myxococcales bacterium]